MKQRQNFKNKTAEAITKEICKKYGIATGTITATKKTVTVKKGDTWAKLAKKYTGSSKNAKKIQKANKMTNKKKPPVGKRIVIPV